MYKFRSMVKDADQRLAEVMRHDAVGTSSIKPQTIPVLLALDALLRRTSLMSCPIFSM